MSSNGRALVVAAVAALLTAGGCRAAEPVPDMKRPVMADTYLDLAATHCCYSRTIWHDGKPGGFWGGGVGEKDGNGAVRGTCSVMLAHALMAYAWKANWLTDEQRGRLEDCGLARDELVRRVGACLEHVCAHHKSVARPMAPTWGQSWQSSLWLGAATVAVFLAWDDLPADQRDVFTQIVGSEADRIAAKPPGDFVPGNTRAEENGWDTQALAAAIALDPQSTRAATWWRALRNYAANTNSVRSDRTSSASLGDETVRDVVRTANLFDDFTLDNHGFFHPDYIKVSTQELAEAWLILALGDVRNRTERARGFEPYAMHHVADIWHQVMSRLLMADGTFLYPHGNDWTFNCSTDQAYFAWIATTLRDPLALAAEIQAIRPVLDRRRLSTGGQILEDSNLEWWWEPLVVKRCTSALLLHAMRPVNLDDRAGRETLLHAESTSLWPNGAAWMHRNGRYAVSVSWARQRMGTFTPFGPGSEEAPYMTLPVNSGILPEGTSTPLEHGRVGDSEVISLAIPGKGRCWTVALPNSVVWLSPVGFRPIGVENDRLSGTGRTLRSTEGVELVPALTRTQKFHTAGNWLSIDNRLGMVTDGTGFEYVPAGGYNRRSAAIDHLVPKPACSVWQMIPCSPDDSTETLSRSLRVRKAGDQIELVVTDGAEGAVYEITANLGAPGTSDLPTGEGIVPRHMSIHKRQNTPKEKP